LKDDNDCAPKYVPINDADDSLFSTLDDGVVLKSLLLKIGANKCPPNLSKIDHAAALP